MRDSYVLVHGWGTEVSLVLLPQLQLMMESS
jgi:hypothetical protein